MIFLSNFLNNNYFVFDDLLNRIHALFKYVHIKLYISLLNIINSGQNINYIIKRFNQESFAIAIIIVDKQINSQKNISKNANAKRARILTFVQFIVTCNVPRHDVLIDQYTLPVIINGIIEREDLLVYIILLLRGTRIRCKFHFHSFVNMARYVMINTPPGL